MNDFEKWMEDQGFNAKQVTAAGRAMGVESQTAASKRKNGHQQLSRMDRLAMAAVAAGLDPWTPETAAQASSIKPVALALKNAVAEAKGPKPTPSKRKSKPKKENRDEFDEAFENA